MGKWFTKEEVESWGEGNKMCRECRKILPIANFAQAPKKHKLLLETMPNCRSCESLLNAAEYRKRHPHEVKHRTYHGKVLDPVEAAWLAGFLEGEGTFHAAYRKDQNCPRVSLTAHQVNKEPLLRLSALCGGSVRGPYKSNNPNANQYYVWGTGGYEAYQYIGAACWKYLSEKRRNQIRYGLSLYRKDTKSA